MQLVLAILLLSPCAVAFTQKNNTYGSSSFSYIFELFQHWFYCEGARGGAATSRKVAGSIPDGIIGIFH